MASKMEQYMFLVHDCVCVYVCVCVCVCVYIYVVVHGWREGNCYGDASAILFASTLTFGKGLVARKTVTFHFTPTVFTRVSFPSERTTLSLLG